jgi:hypothetical protein
MRVLVVGNSQAGALYRSHATGAAGGGDPGGIAMDFYVVPGGTGPTLALDGRVLVPNVVVPDHPPYLSSEAVRTASIDGYDALVVSALGYVDGGFAFRNPIATQGLLAEFGPKANDLASELVSRGVFRQVIDTGLRRQHGFRLLRSSPRTTGGASWSSLGPYLSDALRDRADWWVRRCYEDAGGFHAYLNDLRDSVVAAICGELGVELLDRPDPSWAALRHTPAALMRQSDGVHATDAHGALVLRQIRDHLSGG